MDIPLAEELELLEASSFFPDEEFEDLEPPVEEPPNPISLIPPKPSPDPFPPSETQLDSRKRSRPVIVPDRPTLTNPEPSPVDKRSKIVSPEAEIDDDWLRYSPPPPVEQLVVEDPPPSVDMVMEKKKFVSRYAWEIEGECLPVTAPDGERVYAKISSADNQLVKLDLKLPSKGLIPEPINVLIQRVEQDAFRKVLKASVECPIDVILPEAPVVSEKLWVEKYAPSSFMELLSDEQTNREVLMWLKQWDSCVFGSEIKSTTNDVLSALKRHSSVVQHKNTSNKSYYGRDREPRFSKEAPREFSNVDQENYGSQGSQELWNKKRDGSGPPEQKILLLCGPPGLGKTTLAHVAAKHCGYRVVEINASDDRASSTIETKILDVVQMNSVIADSRPKCLIIDEIDGALGDGKGAVDVILKMVSADKRSDTGKENVAQGDLSGKMSAKKKRKDTSLLRPVICICNDLYAPALRPLRQVAKVHIFIQPTVVRIVNRLKYICTKEGMRTTSIALTALAEYTECDIRSCLNTLQFLNKKKESLNVLDVSSQVVGRKDTSKSVFDIWKEIFWKRIVKRETKSVSGCKSMLNEFDFLHSMISSRGDYDLIVDGIHENLLQLQYHDPVMQKTVKCLRNLEVSDIFYQYVMRTQRMSLQVYQPAIAISVHGLIAQVEKPNIEWPKSYQRYRTTLAEKVDVLHSWHNKVSPNISRHLSTKSFVEDLISPLLHILSPPTLRPCIQNILYSLQECPFLFMIMKNNGHSFWNGGSNIYVALHLLSEKEKKYMEQLVTMMVSYSITYRNAKSDLIPGSLRNEVAIDASVLLLDPPIYEFINFKDYISSYFVLASAVKQVLFHEVEKQKILQAGINKSLPAADMSDNRKQASVGIEVGKPLSTRSDKSTVLTDRITNPKTLSNSRHCEMAASDASTSVPCKSSTTNETVKSSESKPKRLAGSYNFFDRFKKVSANGSQKTDDGKKVPATMERDSRPIIFKFNEGFTNAVKRPVRIREFLL